jgi:hypothetical protein
MRRVGVVKTRKKLFITINMTACKNNATSTKRWAPLSPPDEFNVADAKWTLACVLASRGARGGALGQGRNGGIKMRRLIVQLESRFFFDSAMHNS